MITSNDVPVLDEYCWHHKGDENGGWGCVQCYVEQNLAGFFEWVVYYVEMYQTPLFCEHDGESIGWHSDPAIPTGWGIEISSSTAYYAYQPGGDNGALYCIEDEQHGWDKAFPTYEAALSAILARALRIGARVRILAAGEMQGQQGVIYCHLPSRPAPWHVRPDGWPADEAGVAYMADELEVIA